ncbi:MAG: hypothetical protein JWP95_1062, partial [Actinotalea sp.]|nr:hypothetical protein [Actinotalea sp.]
MIIRLTLAVALAVTCTGLSLQAGPAEPVVAAAAAAGPVPGAPASAASGGQAAAADDVTFTEVGVVVPPVDASGEVLETPDGAQAQADSEVIVTDEVVQGRLEGEVVETDEFQTIGVTWPAASETSEEPDIQVRTRSEGEWSAWTVLEGAEATPDAGSADEVNARNGTHSLWVGEADAVQLSFAATAEGGPEGMELALVASEEPVVASADAIVGEGAATDATTVASLGTLAVPTAVAPAIITRGQWGAAPQVCAPDVASKLVGGVVHHTAGGSSYATVAQAMQQIRNDQAYHINGRGWCDLGYNFVVDKWGNIYEGRANSLTQPVIGVHAGGFNTTTVGVSMLGNFQEVGTSPAMIDAVGRIMGFRLAAYNVDPTGIMSFYTSGGENSKFTNQTVQLPRIFAHRDVAYTTCPGQYGYAQMDRIRAIAKPYYDARLYAESQSVVKALYQDLLGRGPDATGLAGWTAALMQGSSQSDLVSSLTRSDEYISLRVAQAYSEVLGRAPDAGGAAAWLTTIRKGVGSVDDVKRRFYDSSEYVALSGGTPQGYVERLYTTMLERPAVESEVRAMVAFMATYGRGA